LTAGSPAGIAAAKVSMIPKASGLALTEAAVGPGKIGPGRGRPEFGVYFSQHLAHYFFQVLHRGASLFQDISVGFPGAGEVRFGFHE